MACSTGCPTGGHASYGECLRSKNVSTQWLGGTGPSARAQREWSQENERYRQALKDGLNPKGVDTASVRQAYEEAS